jgi:hypothetical protein
MVQKWFGHASALAIFTAVKTQKSKRQMKFRLPQGGVNL